MKEVLNTQMCKINLTESGYQVLVKMSRGGWIEMETLPGNLEGLVTALQLSTEVCAGKFFPRKVLEENKVERKLLASKG